MKNRNRKERSRDGPSFRPSVEDFSPGSVGWEVLKYSLLHPLSFPPVILGLVSLFAAAVLPWKIPFLLVGLAGAAFGVLHAGYKFILKGDVLKNSHVNRLRKHRIEYDSSKVKEIERALSSAGFKAGAKEARQLRKAFDDLIKHLQDRISRGSTNLPAEQFRALAEDVYVEGVGYLERALDLYIALNKIDLSGLKKELRSIEGKLDRLKSDASASDRRDLKEREASLNERIGLHQQKTEELTELLRKSDDLEKILEQTYLKVAALSDGDIKALIKKGDAAKDLRSRVEAAHRAEQRASSGFTGVSRKEQQRDEEVRALLDEERT